MKAEPFWLEGPWPGRLAILPRPRGGDWLEDEIRSWKEQGVRVVVSALTSEENQELDLSKEEELCRQQDIVFVSFPIRDRGLPTSEKDVEGLVRQLDGALEQGQNVSIHCRQGIGRSSLLAASVLASGTGDPAKAFEHIAQVRGRPVPDTQDQRDWVTQFVQRKRPAISRE